MTTAILLITFAPPLLIVGGTLWQLLRNLNQLGGEP